MISAHPTTVISIKNAVIDRNREVVYIGVVCASIASLALLVSD